MWPEHWDVMNLFVTLRTQWRYSFGGPAGLDYTAITPTLDMLGIEVEDRRALFSDLQTLESEALSLMHTKNKQ